MMGRDEFRTTWRTYTVAAIEGLCADADTNGIPEEVCKAAQKIADQMIEREDEAPERYRLKKSGEASYAKEEEERLLACEGEG